MATSPKILLIRYADKLAFLVALGILGYAATSSFLLKDKADSGQASELKEIRDLTPGDFKTVHLRQQYASEGALPLESVNALKKEVSYKRTRSSFIGFAV